MLNFDVKRKINTLRDILVGKVPDPKAQVEQITIALIYKFMDDIDLRGVDFGGTRVFFSSDYEKYAFSQIMLPEHSAQDRLNLYAEGIDKMTNNPDLPKLFRDILRNAYIPYRDPETLNRFLREINEFSYEDSEELGNAFEYLLSIMGSQGDAGQFRTPRHIIDMMVKITAPAKNETILDPACGTAGFLISAYNYIKETNKDKKGKSTLSADDRKRISQNFAGYDISPDMVRLSRVNMYLHDFKKPNISEYDTLTSLDKWDDTYDVIFANPPFMTPKGGITPHNRYRVSAKRAEVLFVDYIVEHLNPNGRAAIIVPEGIVFQSQTAYKNLRKMIVEDNYLYGVISLPAGVFNPYSGVKTSILLIDRKLAKERDSILFVKLNNDGYDLGAQRREIKGSEIPDVINIFKDYQKGVSVEGRENVLLVKKSDIGKKSNNTKKNNDTKKNDGTQKNDSVESEYILVGERYKDNSVCVIKWPVVALGEVCEINPKKSELKDISSETWVSFVPMNILNEHKKDFKTKEIRHIREVYTGYTYFKDGDVLLAKVTPCFENGKSGIAKELMNGIGFGSSEFFVLRPKKSCVMADYIYRLISTDAFIEQGKQKMTGTGGLQRIPKYFLTNHLIPLPPLKVQEEIVTEIEGYQKIIDGARQVVDNYKPTIKIDSTWPTARIGSICELQAGGTPSRDVESYWEHNDFPWYTSGELNEIYTGSPLKYISKKGFENSSARLFPKGSLLIGMYDTAAFKMSILDRDATFNQAVCGVKPSSVVDMLFLLLYFTGKRETYLKMRVGARQRNLTKQLISDLVIPIPPMEVQLQIVQKVIKELKIVEQNKCLIEIFQQKIKNKIAEVWGEDK